MCLTYETHLADVIYHRALFVLLLLFQKKIAAQEGHWGDGDSRPHSWGMTGVPEKETVKSEKSESIRIFQLRNPFVCLLKLEAVPKYFGLLYYFLISWEKMSKTFPEMGISFPKVGWGHHGARSSPAVPGPFGKLLVCGIPVARGLAEG